MPRGRGRRPRDGTHPGRLHSEYAGCLFADAAEVERHGAGAGGAGRGGGAREAAGGAAGRDTASDEAEGDGLGADGGHWGRVVWRAASGIGSRLGIFLFSLAAVLSKGTPFCSLPTLPPAVCATVHCKSFDWLEDLGPSNRYPMRLCHSTCALAPAMLAVSGASGALGGAAVARPRHALARRRVVARRHHRPHAFAPTASTADDDDYCEKNACIYDDREPAARPPAAAAAGPARGDRVRLPRPGWRAVGFAVGAATFAVARQQAFACPPPLPPPTSYSTTAPTSSASASAPSRAAVAELAARPRPVAQAVVARASEAQAGPRYTPCRPSTSLAASLTTFVDHSHSDCHLSFHDSLESCRQ